MGVDGSYAAEAAETSGFDRTEGEEGKLSSFDLKADD